MAIVFVSFVVLLTGILGAYFLFIVRPETQAQRAFWRRLRIKGPSREVRSKLLKQAQQLSALLRAEAK